MKSVYALLVGIDDYPHPVPALRGCGNDVAAMRAYLEGRVGADDAALHVRTLLNAEATRAAVVAGFRDHLRRAGPDDVALFCYSGHGSRELAPEDFWHIEPDHLNETLVCHDSRADGSWGLADKELALLLYEVASRGAHVVVVLDCCHSGSGTRAGEPSELTTRRLETDLRPRPLDTYLVRPTHLPATRATGTGGGWRAAAGRHVLFAACRDDEEAREYAGGGTTRGAFSYFLGEVLRAADSLTYRDLFGRVNAHVRGRVQRQSPQLEATAAEDLDQPFLGGVIQPRARSFVASLHDGRWHLDAGRVDGIPPAADDAAEFGLYPFDAPAGDLEDPEKAVATVRAVRVFATATEAEVVGGGPGSAVQLKAVLTHLPTPRLRVRVEGDAAGVGPARAALAGSRFVCEAAAADTADYRLLARGGAYLIAKPGDDDPLVGQVAGYTGAAAGVVVRRLEHIERWKSTAELDNPASTIGADELRVDFLQNDRPLTGGEVRLDYARQPDGSWVQPEVVIRLRNTGTRTLFVGLLDLPQTFGIFPLLADVGCQRLDGGQEAFANRGEPVPFSVPDEFWTRGAAEIKDVIQVIVGTAEFDARRLAQPDLDLPRDKTRSVSPARGSLDRLMDRVQDRTRHAGGPPARRVDDWRALQFGFTTVRPLPADRLGAGRGVTLTGGVKVEPHPAFRAGAVRVGSLPAATRALGAVAALPRLLTDNSQVVGPFEFAPRTLDSVLNVIEFEGVANPEAVTPDQPLRVIVPRPLAPGEEVLPVGFDGEFYLPLGRAAAAGRDTVIELDRLPALVPAATRTLGGAVRVLVQKVAGRYFGTAYPYPLLAAAAVGSDGRVEYEADPGRVRERVGKASRVALFVHGIIGDTRVMASSLSRAGAGGRYDLVLTFDYESLNDPIPETARSLKKRLAETGLGPDHGKSLDVFAHSMGGLVSRWLVEREGGNRQVRRLAMFGTPNGGSPWPAVGDWATTALALGLNGLTAAAWPSAVLSGLVKAARWANVTLDQLKPDSAFLKDLAASPDPAVPYTVVTGNTALLAPAGGDGSRLSRMLSRLWSGRAKYDAADLLFGGGANDLAVSGVSMVAVADRRPAVRLVRVGCDHLTYFSSPDGLRAVAAAAGEDE